VDDVSNIWIVVVVSGVVSTGSSGGLAARCTGWDEVWLVSAPAAPIPATSVMAAAAPIPRNRKRWRRWRTPSARA
jgi:hypothetical protein